jgi:excisionase family DNA binding protein
MESLTLEALPKAFSKLATDVSEIKRMLLEHGNTHQSEPNRWFDLIELCQYHPDKPTKSTVYGWVNAGTIPVHKGGKKLRFLKSEIDEWLKQGRKKTVADMSREADVYLSSKKKGGSHA